MVGPLGNSTSGNSALSETFAALARLKGRMSTLEIFEVPATGVKVAKEILVFSTAKTPGSISAMPSVLVLVTVAASMALLECSLEGSICQSSGAVKRVTRMGPDARTAMFSTPVPLENW